MRKIPFKFIREPSECQGIGQYKVNNDINLGCGSAFTKKKKKNLIKIKCIKLELKKLITRKKKGHMMDCIEPKLTPNFGIIFFRS